MGGRHLEVRSVCAVQCIPHCPAQAMPTASGTLCSAKAPPCPPPPARPPATSSCVLHAPPPSPPPQMNTPTRHEQLRVRAERLEVLQRRRKAQRGGAAAGTGREVVARHHLQAWTRGGGREGGGREGVQAGQGSCRCQHRRGWGWPRRAAMFNEDGPDGDELASGAKAWQQQQNVPWTGQAHPHLADMQIHGVPRPTLLTGPNATPLAHPCGTVQYRMRPRSHLPPPSY